MTPNPPRAASGRKRLVPALAVLLAAACLAHLPLACRSADEQPKPNVLLITVDTLRADHLGSYGFSAETSPEIDALAAQGVLFERAIAAASRTVPAHASIMTSRYTRGHSVGHLNGKSALRGRQTLADLFGEAGYDTAAFIGNILLTRSTGLGRGFDLFDDDIETPELNRPDVVERLAPDTTQRALAWIARPREEPFFLWVHYQDPHGPYTPPPELAQRFSLPSPPGEKPLGIGKDNRGRRGIPSYQVLPGLRLASEYRSRYAGEIFYADRSIGELLDAVDAVGANRAIPRPSVVLLTADHGESLGENARYFIHTHATTPDVAHVPFILRAPGLTPGRRPGAVSHVDVMPTLLDLAGIEIPPDAEGIALAPIVRAGAALPDRFVYCDIGAQLSAYRGHGFVQVRDLAGAWPDEGEPPVSSSPRWRRFEWDPGRPWRPAREPSELPREILDYARTAEPMEHLPPPGPELTEQLRALGYLDN